MMSKILINVVASVRVNVMTRTNNETRGAFAFRRIPFKQEYHVDEGGERKRERDKNRDKDGDK